MDIMKRPNKEDQQYWLETTIDNGISTTPFNHSRYEDDLDRYIDHLENEVHIITETLRANDKIQRSRERPTFKERLAEEIKKRDDLQLKIYRSDRHAMEETDPINMQRTNPSKEERIKTTKLIPPCVICPEYTNPVDQDELEKKDPCWLSALQKIDDDLTEKTLSDLKEMNKECRNPKIKSRVLDFVKGVLLTSCVLLTFVPLIHLVMNPDIPMMRLLFMFPIEYLFALVCGIGYVILD